jgi:hypothetical protein
MKLITIDVWMDRWVLSFSFASKCWLMTTDAPLVMPTKNPTSS